MRIALLPLISASLLLGQSPAEKQPPVLVKFVAPPYPRAAKALRIMGKAVASITISRDGSVAVENILVHPVFEASVSKALQEWRFRPSGGEQTLRVTFLFELKSEECEGADKPPMISETHVSAELPTLVHISTGLPCAEIDRNQKTR